MVDYYIYAWDSYSSIFENENGHYKGLETMIKFFTDATKIKGQSVAGERSRPFKMVFLHWGGDFSEASGDKTTSECHSWIKKWVEREPEWIIRCLKDQHIDDAEDKVKLLYIISDSVISKKSTKKCMALNKNMHYKKVVFYAFNKDPEKIDLSVAAPFFKNHCTVYRNYELCYSADISKKFDYDKINADNFAAEKDQLKSYIKLKYINKLSPDAGVWQEIEKLTKLRCRLLEELTEYPGKYIFFGLKREGTERNLPTDKTESIDYWERLTAASVITNDVNESFEAMLEYIMSNKNSYSFDALKFDPKVDKPVAEEPMADADSTNNNADSTDDDADSIDDDADFIDDDADSIDDDAESMDDDADSMDDDADSMDDDADSMDNDSDSMDDDADSNVDDADSTDDDAEPTADKDMKFLDILLEHKGGISIWTEYMKIMYG